MRVVTVPRIRILPAAMRISHGCESTRIPSSSTKAIALSPKKEVDEPVSNNARNGRPLIENFNRGVRDFPGAAALSASPCPTCQGTSGKPKGIFNSGFPPLRFPSSCETLGGNPSSYEVRYTANILEKKCRPPSPQVDSHLDTH